MDTVSLIRGNLGRAALPKERRIYFMNKTEIVAQDSMLFSGGDPTPFNFQLASTTDNQLIDSYVGVDFSIVYKVIVILTKKDGGKAMETSAKFDCRVPGGGISQELGRRNKAQDFSITPDQMVAEPKAGGKVPRFHFTG